jgi:hypothetical protein
LTTTYYYFLLPKGHRKKKGVPLAPKKLACSCY